MNTEAETRMRELVKEMTSLLGEWRRNHPKATFLEIEEAVEPEIAKLRVELLSDLAHASSAAEGKEPSGERVKCPQCGKRTKRQGRRKRTLTAAGGAGVGLTRQALTCAQCGHTFFPPGSRVADSAEPAPNALDGDVSD